LKTATFSLGYKKILIHCEKVSKLVAEIFPDNNNLVLAGLMHDIGKIEIPLTVLNKAGPLTIEELDLIKKHPLYGVKIIQGMGYCDEIANSVLHHHERWDGNGYPGGLKGTAIPLFSRIIAVTDAFDAMLTNRPYKRALTKDEAIRELIAEAGYQFDPGIVEDFVSLVQRKSQWEG